jgi:hypothetical protein
LVAENWAIPHSQLDIDPIVLWGSSSPRRNLRGSWFVSRMFQVRALNKDVTALGTA